MRSPIWSGTTQIPTKRPSPSLPNTKHMPPESLSSIGVAVRTLQAEEEGEH